MQLELTQEENEVLSETLQIALSELRYEIANTDKQDFREGLKHKRELLQAIHARLTLALASAAASASPSP